MPPPAIADPNATPPTPDAPDPGAAVGVMPASEVPSDVISSESDRNDRHFRTDHLLDDLKGRSIRGGAVTLTAQAAKFVLKLGETIVLARLLTPADFGLVAMVTAITGMVAMFKDAGLSMATVQRARITHEQVSTLFWINVALSLALMLVVAALAPLVVWLYGEPRLLGITLAVAGSFIFAGLSVQHTALLKRQMRFTSLAAVDLTSMALAVSVALLMAWYGAGYWALVGLLVAQPIVQFVMVWRLSGWRPGLPRRGCGVRPMLAFGGYHTGANFLIYLRRNIDNILLGAVWGPGALGLYMKAYQLLTLPVQQVNGPVSQVVVPALSRLMDHPARYRSFYRRAMFFMTSIGMPIAAFVIVGAEEIIRLVLGPKWMDAVPIFIVLAPAAIATTMNVAGGWIFVSTGRTDKQFRANIGMLLFIGAGILAGLPWGPIGVAAGFSICLCLAIVPLFAYAMHGSPISLSDLGSAVWIPALAATGAAVVTIVTAMVWRPGPEAFQVLVMAMTFGLVYVGIWTMFAQPSDRPHMLARSFRVRRSNVPVGARCRV